MKARPGKARKKYTLKRKIVITTAIAVMATIILISALNQRIKKELNTPKQDPNKYFLFLNAEAQGQKLSGSTTALKIEYLQFNLMPVSGDAHDVVIFTEGMTNPKDYWYPEIKNGTTKSIAIQFAVPIRVIKQPDDTYLIEVEVYSRETWRNRHVFKMRVDEEIGNYVFLKEE
jgi:hypothetical protein